MKSPLDPLQTSNTTTRISRRQMLLALPALALAPRAVAQAANPPIRTLKINHFTLRVSDVKRSVDFYQGLFGMPIQSKQGSTVCLRLGSGPQFLAISQAAQGEMPGFDHLCVTVKNFNVDRIAKVLKDRGFAKVDAPSTTTAGKAGPMKMWIRNRGPESGGARKGTPELYFSDQDSLVVQLQDPSYCGGAGALGNACPAVEASPKKGLIALKDWSHLTVFSSDGPRSTKF